MRNEQKWKERILPGVLDELPPRIKQDIINLDPKTNTSLQSCYIWGDVGTGKTIIAALLFLEAKKLQYLEEYSMTVAFWKMSEMITKVKSLFGSPDEFTFLEELKTMDVLIIDDFGVEKSSEWLTSFMYSLIDYRYEYLKTTIITSNASLEAISDILGDDRISSRISRMGIVIHKKPYQK